MKQRWIIKQKVSLAIAMSVIMIVSFSACGNKNKISKDLSSIEKQSDDDETANAKNASTDKTQESTTEKTRGKLAEQMEMPEKITVDPVLEDGTQLYKVDADIVIPCDEKPGVYEEKLIGCDVDSVNKLAKEIFDNGEYEQVKPIFCYTKEELEQEKGELIAKCKNKNSATFLADKSRLTDILWLLESDFKPGKYVKNGFSTHEGYGKYEQVAYQYDGDTDETTLEHTGEYAYTVNPERVYMVQGKMNGIPYRMESRCTDYGEGFQDEKSSLNISNLRENRSEFQISPYDMQTEHTIFAGGQKFTVDESDTAEENRENKCSYTMDQARELAAKFLEHLLGKKVVERSHKYSVGTYANSFVLKVLEEDAVEQKDSDGETPIVGYCFDFDVDIDGLLADVQSEKSMEELSDALEQEKEALVSYRSAAYGVVVDSDGIVSVGFLEAYQPGKILAKKAELMSVDNLKPLIEEYLKKSTEIKVKNHSLDDSIPMVTINTMKLCRMNINYNGSCSSCPVWVFGFQSQGVWQGSFPDLVINAMDGSLISRAEHNYNIENIQQ